MARAVTISNGNLLVGIDHRGQVRDLYFPFVGHANQVSGGSGTYTHRVGVWVDGTLRWLSHESWTIVIEAKRGKIAATFIAQNEELGVTLSMSDMVHNEKNIFIRKIAVSDDRGERRTIKVFFGQEFRISESRRGDTALFDPRVSSIIHYKGHEAFLIHARLGEQSFTDYSVGLFGIENKEGTYLDAEDGELAKNPIEHGSVDSVIGLGSVFEGKSSMMLYYWITAGHSIREAHDLHGSVLQETPNALFDSASDYWHAWTGKDAKDLGAIEAPLQDLYERSLLVIRMHADNRGGIIASSDSDMLNQGRDYYSYVWPRDASASAAALDRAGYFDTTERLFVFLSKLLEHDGYLMHKYRVDGVLGSSWHPWVRNGVSQLPIQEDETALPLCTLWEHYQSAKDLEFLESLYNPFIEPASDFLCGYIDDDTGLPSGSYDLWEEKFGTSTYTASCVFGALISAAHISTLLGKRENAKKYHARAESIQQAILAYLYDLESQTFIKLVQHEKGKLVRDTTLDISSLYGIVRFGVLSPFDIRVQNMVKHVETRLHVPTSFGGYMRYEGDRYYKTAPDETPNAWCITTLWMAQYYIQIAHSRAELARAYDILQWVRDRAEGSGILPEQIDPHSGAHLSASPLVWSHAEFVITIDQYIKKYASLA